MRVILVVLGLVFWASGCGGSGGSAGGGTTAGDGGGASDSGAVDSGGGEDAPALAVTLPTGSELTLVLPDDALAEVGLSASDFSVEIVELGDDLQFAGGLIADLGGAAVEIGPEGTVFPVPVNIGTDQIAGQFQRSDRCPLLGGEGPAPSPHRP